MKKNMNSPQRKAITIQNSSIPCIGSFHQRRFVGGLIAMTVPRPNQLATGMEAISITPQTM